MDFPVYVFGIHPHHVFDDLSFLVGGRLFWWEMKRAGPGRTLTRSQKWALALGAFIGAALGAKLIVLLEDPAFTLAHFRELGFWLSGKSIVGGILGGYAGVEIAKRDVGVTWSTGDRWVVPLAAGLAVGRIGCFLSGLTDDAYGVPTGLPWGVDFGDGPRHPTQLYEIAFCLAFLAWLLVMRRRRAFAVEGIQLRLFLVAYFAFRFLEEFIRVSPRPWLGLTIYQVACAGGLAWLLWRREDRAAMARSALGSAEA